ncbi:Uncharacterized protein APZ42_003017, partial [Daphnia magna]
IDELLAQAELLGQMLPQSLHAVALGGMVAGGDEGHAGLGSQMGLRLGNLASDEHIGAGRNRLFKITLSPTGAPGNALQHPPIT